VKALLVWKALGLADGATHELYSGLVEEEDESFEELSK
jgi:hypothetical protein